MYPITIIKESLMESFSIIKKNKKIFSLILILQLLFFLLITIASSYYTPKIVESSISIMEHMQELNLQGLDLNTAGITNQQINTALVSRNYTDIIKNAYLLLILVFIIFVLFNGVMWHFSISILSKKAFLTKNILPFLLKFFMASVVLYLFFYLLAYSLINIFFSGFLLIEPKNYLPLFLLSIAAIYFIYIAIPLLNKINIRIKDILTIGINHFLTIMMCYLIMISTTLLVLMLAFISIGKSLFLVIALLLILALVFAWGRIFLSSAIKKVYI